MTINIQLADITTLNVDAIVNAANEGLIPGSGVDGAIRRAAGPELTRATAVLGRCPTGEAVLSLGYRLPALFVIHTTAPVYSQHTEEETKRLLTQCYRNVLNLAGRHGIESIAFPALGTGIYGIPLALAAPVAMRAISDHLATARAPRTAIMCCWDAQAYDAHRRAIGA